MPGRHVRFSTENTVYSPPSRSSATSSSGPPSHPHARLPGPTPFVPRRSHTVSSSAKGRAHNLVALADSPLLSYDVSLHPSAITTYFPGVSSAGFLEPAVFPPQLAMTIVTPHLPWAIPVGASNGRYVTVSDAVNAIYRSLRTNVTPAEFHSLGSQKLMRRASEAYTQRYTVSDAVNAIYRSLRTNVTPAEFHSLGSQKLMRRASEAYTQRYMRLRGHRGYDEEKKQGVKRVDFLMGCTKFRGLSSTNAPDVWRIHIS
ncbi:hypothetical protein DFH06DRAFT_722818 [Mycena polygramma]|nr:hypothetical protein DFH06DRAFT_722818 [Mycena polygramma]